MSNTSARIAVVIMSGLPGSGKSTWVNKLLDNKVQVRVCSADHFFTFSNGEYRFNPSQLGAAHFLCMRNFVNAIQDASEDNGLTHIVVDNTNLSWEEIVPYYSVAKAFGALVYLVTVSCDVETACARNVHKVPRNAIEAMHSRLQSRSIPSFADIEYVDETHDTF